MEGNINFDSLLVITVLAFILPPPVSRLQKVKLMADDVLLDEILEA